MVLPVALALLQFAMPAGPVSRVSGQPVTTEVAVSASANTASVGTDPSPASAPAASAEGAKAATNGNGAPESASAPSSASSTLTPPAVSSSVASQGESTAVPELSAAIPGGAAMVASPQPGEASVPESSSLTLAPAPSPAAMISAAEKADEQRRWLERQKHVWLALSIAQSTAAAFDGYSTRLVVGSGRGVEMNPMLRPFAGNASLYAAIEVTPLAIDYVSRRMLMSRHAVLRRSWWIPQVVGTGVSLVSGARNMAVYSN